MGCTCCARAMTSPNKIQRKRRNGRLSSAPFHVNSIRTLQAKAKAKSGGPGSNLHSSQNFLKFLFQRHVHRQEECSTNQRITCSRSFYPSIHVAMKSSLECVANRSIAKECGLQDSMSGLCAHRNSQIPQGKGSHQFSSTQRHNMAHLSAEFLTSIRLYQSITIFSCLQTGCG